MSYAPALSLKARGQDPEAYANSMLSGGAQKSKYLPPAKSTYGGAYMPPDEDKDFNDTMTGFSKGVDAGATVNPQPMTVGEGVLSTLAAGVSGAAAGGVAGGPLGALTGGVSALVIGGLNSFMNYNRGKREAERQKKENAIAEAKYLKEQRRIEAIDAANLKLSQNQDARARETLELNKQKHKADMEKLAYENAIAVLTSKLPAIQAYLQAEQSNRNRYYATGMV